MSPHMTKSRIFIVLLVLCLIAGGSYAYWLVGRPVAAPSASQTPSVSTPVAPTNPTNVFRIVPESSKATFTLGEDLRGVRTTVVGTTQDVSGDITVDPNNVGAARIGTIKINARTFKTDSESRNRAIVRMIFKSEETGNEFITFTPSSISVASSTIEVTGSLTISGVTNTSTFTGTYAFASDTELTGHVGTLLRYADFGLSVPELPFLANVDKQVELTFDFIAKK